MSSITKSQDFPDWLSPMLVKELRQGLRSWVFMTAFIIAQVAMTFAILVKLLNEDARRMDYIGTSMWLSIMIMLFAVQPMRAAQMLRSEIQSTSLELVIMSNLSADRIVLGKWISFCSQSLLFITSVLPYFIVRYFFGRLEIAAEVSALGIVVVCSFALLAGALLLSTMNLMARIIVIAFGSPIVLTVLAGLGITGGSLMGMLCVLLFTCGFFTFICLSVASANIVSIAGHVMRQEF